MSHLITGDFHNGDPDQDTEGLREFLKWSKHGIQIRTHTVIADGDVWHYSRMPICAIDDMPLPDIGLRGNHDGECSGKILHCHGDSWTSPDGKTYAEHGHHEKMWQKLDSKPRKRWVINRILKYGYCRENKLGDPDNIMRAARRIEAALMPRGWQVDPNAQVHYGKDIAFRNLYDWVVLAHTHRPGVWPGYRVVNVGAWTPAHAAWKVEGTDEYVEAGDIPSFFWNVEERSFWRWVDGQAKKVWEA